MTRQQPAEASRPRKLRPSVIGPAAGAADDVIEISSGSDDGHEEDMPQPALLGAISPDLDAWFDRINAMRDANAVGDADPAFSLHAKSIAKLVLLAVFVLFAVVVASDPFPLSFTHCPGSVILFTTLATQ
jgi:hypothetical protein